jgi:hypothetical protein
MQVAPPCRELGGKGRRLSAEFFHSRLVPIISLSLHALYGRSWQDGGFAFFGVVAILGVGEAATEFLTTSATPARGRGRRSKP